MRQMKDSGYRHLGQIPAEWNMTRGKQVLRLLQREIRENDGVITCFRDGEVTLRTNRRTDGFTVSLKEIGYQGIEPGDLVVHGMDGFAGAIGISDSRGKASPVLNVLDSEEDKRFLMYYLRALAYREVYLALADGIRVRSCNLSWKKIGSLPIALPSLEEQQRISRYLDEQCSEIDSAIQSAEASVREYERLRDAFIFDAVTNGLTSQSKKQPSRVSWVEEFPRHWEIKKIKYVLHERNESNSDLELDTVLSLSARYGVTLYSERVGGGNKSKANLEDYKKARAGDIVLNSMNIVSGSVGISPYDGCVSPVYYMFYLKTGEGDIRFFNYVFQTDRFQKSLFGLGNGIMVKESSTGKLNTVRMRISPTAFKAQFVPVPPIIEQTRIADYLDQRCATIDQLICAKQSIIEDLRAYKQSLVYEVVTGKREV